MNVILTLPTLRAIIGRMDLLLTILVFLLELTFVLVCLTVLLSFTMAWYERANSDPDVITRRFTSRGISLSFWLMLQEAFSLLATLALRPFGWGNPKTMFHETTDQQPIIVLHGLFQNRSCLFWLRYQLQRAGFKNVMTINTPPWRDIDTLTEILIRKIDEVRIAHKVDKVCLVGHSMGGMIARNYVQLRGGAPRVSCCITLGSPHKGSKLAPFALSQLGKSLLPGTPFLQKINAAPKPAEGRIVSIYSRHDNIVLPATNAQLNIADENIELDGMGHTAMLFHPKAIRAVITQITGVQHADTPTDVAPDQPAD